VLHLDQQCIHALAFDQRHDGFFVCRINDSVALPVAHLFTLLNVGWTLADGAAIEDLAASVTSA